MSEGIEVETPPEECDWLVLIYMDIGGPELIEPAKAELFELVAALVKQPGAAPSECVQVVVQTTGLLLDGRNTRGTRRYRIAGGQLKDLSPRVKGRKYGEREEAAANPPPPDPFAGDYDYPLSTAQSLKSLILDGWRQTQVRARRKMLIIWGHGAGVGSGLDLTTVPTRTPADQVPSKTLQPWSIHNFGLTGMTSRRLTASVEGILSRDKQRPGDGPQPAMNATTSTVVEEALLKAGAEIKKGEIFDLIIFDSCFLSSAEMAFEVRRLTRYFIASQGTVGFPTLDLTRILHAMQGRGTTDEDLLELGRIIVDQALDVDSGAVGLSLFRCSVENWGDPPWDFLQCFRSLVAALRLAIWIPELRSDIRQAFEAAAWVEVRQFVDVVDLAVRLQRCRQPGPAPSAEEYPLDSDLYKKLTRFEHELHQSLRRELTEAAENLVNLLATPNGFLAYHQSRRVPAGQEQGISIYLPWFRSSAGGANVKVDPSTYSSLDLNVYSRWSDFIYAISPEDTQADVSAEEELHRLRAALASLGSGELDLKRDRLDTKRDRLDTKRDRLDTKRDRLAVDDSPR
jgi:hypothetical protein